MRRLLFASVALFGAVQAHAADVPFDFFQPTTQMDQYLKKNGMQIFV